MRLKEPRPLTPRVTMLGRPECNLYLVRGDHGSAILGGGLTLALPEVEDQLARAGAAAGEIAWLIPLHAHFDHIGLIPSLKRRLPGARILASPGAAELVARPQVRQTIETFNREFAAHLGRLEVFEREGADFDGLAIELVAAEGLALDLGGVSLVFMLTPGHSTCSMSVYLPEEKALFASDAGGVPQDDHVITVASSNFEDYLASMARLEKLDIEFYLAEHYGGFSGPEAARYLAFSQAEARSVREMIRDSYLRARDIEQTAAELVEFRRRRSPGYFLTDKTLFLVTRQMVKNAVALYGW